VFVVLYKVLDILADGNIDVMKVRLMVLELQSHGKLEIIIVDGDLQGSFARKSAHLHPCTSLPWVIVDLRFFDFGLILRTVVRV
jgi:hypothetical protein